MPQLNVTVKSAEQVWATPDGKMKIFKVKLDAGDGNELEAKTYSDAIAVEGWSGTVETYEKQNKRGESDTFVKQPAKEFSGSRYGGGSKPQADPYTMYLSYSKDLVVAMLNNGGYDEKQFKSLLAAVDKGGKALYTLRPDAPKETKEE